MRSGTATRAIVRTSAARVATGGAQEPRYCAVRGASALEVLGEHQRFARADSLQPLAGEAVGERPVGIGERRVGRFAEQRLAERVLRLARELALAAREQHLALH